MSPGGSDFCQTLLPCPSHGPTVSERTRPPGWEPRPEDPGSGFSPLRVLLLKPLPLGPTPHTPLDSIPWAGVNQVTHR